MTDVPPPVDFDARPPMPLSEYEQTVQRVNVGYDLVFTLTGCFLRALGRPELALLAVGAGGGAEVEHFLPDNPGWRLTGVDPSQEMLALAQAKAEHLRVDARAMLTRGTVDDLPTEARFDAATCVFVLHFLSDDNKLTLLRGIRARLRPGAPLLAVSGACPGDGGLRDDLLGAWQQYGELMGMPPERMAAIIGQLMVQPQTSGADYVRLLGEAGFPHVVPFFSVLGGFITGWLAR